MTLESAGRLGRGRCGPEQERGAPAGRHGADHDRPHRRYHRGHGSGPAVTGIWAGCVAIARPYALGIPGRARHDARVSGTADLQSRTIAVIPGPSRHERKSTANAVGLYGPPGFKSPILRSDQQFRPGARLRGTAGFCFAGPLRGHRRNPAARLPSATRAAARASAMPESGPARPHHQSADRDVCRWFASRPRHSVRSAKAQRQGRRDKGLAPAADPTRLSAPPSMILCECAFGPGQRWPPVARQYFWATRPEIVGDVVYRVPRCTGAGRWSGWI